MVSNSFLNASSRRLSRVVVVAAFVALVASDIQTAAGFILPPPPPPSHDHGGMYIVGFSGKGVEVMSYFPGPTVMTDLHLRVSVPS